jgi:hypothetical protein
MEDVVMTGVSAADERSIGARMAEILERVQLLESNLPKRVDALISHSKLPFRALVIREAAIRRMAELSRGAFEHFKADALVLAILATRAAIETSAALWYLRAKLATTVEVGVLGNIDDCLMRLGWGTKSDKGAEMPEAMLKKLQAHRKKQEENRAHFGDSYQGNYIFCNPDGSPVKPDTISAAVSLLFRTLNSRKAPVSTRCGTRTARNSWNGVPLTDVSKRPGHVNPHVTATIYAHAPPAGTISPRPTGSRFRRKPALK